MTIALRTLALAALLALASAADLPLGLVDRVEADAVTVRFDAAARLGFGQMVALYAPGRVVKHPLTGKVVTEERVLQAKGQIIARDGGAVRLRLLWRADGAAPAAGWDAVPLPGEAAPNAPPVLTAALSPLAAAAGATVALKLPVADPDRDPLVINWELSGPAGRSGRLDARITTRPENVWTAPGTVPEDELMVVATVRDPFRQEIIVRLPLTVGAAADPRRERVPFAGLGLGQEPAWSLLAPTDDGAWIGIDDGGRIWRAAPGWLAAAPLALTEAPRRPVAVWQHGGEVFVLDRDRQTVVVFDAGGVQRRVLSGLSEVRSLAVGPDGSVLVADQRAGGVMVFDAGGRFRARAGRIAEDGFAEVTRVAVTPQGGMIVLDAVARRLHRYDADLRRLDTWTVTGDPKLKPVDLAVHPQAVLVLFEDGSVQAYAATGTVAATWKPAAESGLADNLGAGVSIAADAAGQVLICHANGITARLDGQGRVLGLRGPTLLRSSRSHAVDGLGRLYALDVDRGQVIVHDPHGWRIAVIGGRARSGGPFGEAGPMAVAPDGSAIVVLDVDKRTVVRFDGRDLAKAPLIFGGSGSNLGQFSRVTAVAVDGAGRSYVLDESNARVSVFDPGGQFLFAFGESGRAPNQLREPTLVAVSAAGDAAYVFDADRYEVKKFGLDQAARSGRHLATGGGRGSEPGQFRRGSSMDVDRQGLLHILDTSRGDWQVVDFRQQSLLPLTARRLDELLRGATSLAVSPDGPVWLFAGGGGIGVR